MKRMFAAFEPTFWSQNSGLQVLSRFCWYQTYTCLSAAI